jgi:predicted aspartyl protease
MKSSIKIAICILLITGNYCFSQQNIPILKTNSTRLDIKEGGKLDKGGWTLDPELKLDIYELPNKRIDQTITLYSDLDSITINIKPNNIYDFIVLLNNKDKFSCRISSKFNNYRKDCKNCIITKDEIPFTIGSDNRILINGKLNNGEKIDFMFDTGAGSDLLYKTGLKKSSQINFTGQGIISGGGGQATTKLSMNNKLQIADLIWDNYSFQYLEKQADKSDALIGFSVFEDKVVEINHDSKIMTIHSALPKLDNGYKKCNFKKIGGLYFIELTLQIGNKQITEWFDFDTGNTGSITIHNELANEQKLNGLMEKIGESSYGGIGPNKIFLDRVMLPKLKIGGFELDAVPILIEKPSTVENLSYPIVGVEILNRFNMVIDYQNSVVYLKPNSNISQPYFKKKDNAIIFVISLCVILLSISSLYFYKRRQRKIQFNQ